MNRIGYNESWASVFIFFIGLLLGNRLITLALTRGRGSTLGGLEFMRGRFGSSLVTLLLTSRFASVLFFLLAIIDVSVKTSFRNSSWSIVGQCMWRISLAASHRGPNFIGRTSRALLSLFLDVASSTDIG